MSLLSMMMSHERKKWICINQSQVSIQAVDQSEASIHLHEHLAAVAGHGGPPLAQLLYQAGHKHNMLPAPASASVPVVQAEATILSQAKRRKYLVAT